MTGKCDLTADVQFEFKRQVVGQCCYGMVLEVPLVSGWPSSLVTDHRRVSAVPCLLLDMHRGLGAACSHAYANSLYL